MFVLYETYRSRSPESSVTIPESRNATLSRASVTIPGMTGHDPPEYPVLQGLLYIHNTRHLDQLTLKAEDDDFFDGFLR